MSTRYLSRFTLLATCLMLTLLGSVSLEAASTPVIRMKVAEYPREVGLSLPEGGTWALAGKSGKLGPKDRVVLSAVLEKPAHKRFHVIVESVALREPGKLTEALEKWKAAGRPAQPIMVGKKSMADDGRTVLFDGRVAFLAVGRFDAQKAAQTLVDELSKQSQSSWIFEEILRRSVGRLALSINKRTVATGRGELALTPRGTTILQRLEYAKGYSWHGFQDRTFRGPLVIRWGAQDALDAVLTTDLETILAGVVPSEISAKAAIGALQAQAVAARGEILGKVGLRHIGEGFDFCAEQHCQVFAGETAEARAMAAKIAPTRGLLLESPEGAIVDAVYAANCGGHGEANHLVWTSPPDPQLKGVWDCASQPALDLRKEADVETFIADPPAAWCANATVEGGDKFRWQKPLSKADWQKVEAAGDVGRIREVKGFARGFSGRIYRLTLVGEKGERTIMKELKIRQLFGGLRSACFVADWQRDGAGFITCATFIGAGWGHGVGMCQTGAQSMAQAGADFRRILSHYFPGSKLVQFY
jgi:SpoIID/LytB domain protein